MKRLNATFLAARSKRGLTQKQLADKTRHGLNHFSIVLIERYGWLPPEPTQRRLAQVLCSSPEALFGEAISELVALHR